MAAATHTSADMLGLAMIDAIVVVKCVAVPGLPRRVGCGIGV